MIAGTSIAQYRLNGKRLLGKWIPQNPKDPLILTNSYFEGINTLYKSDHWKPFKTFQTFEGLNMGSEVRVMLE